ncbi:MAG: hypothetical protein A2045_17320 [Rhodocyclales bacterium GWA2_65_20]|nr:MAG: hypothetical protein A2045_17320 [Rhodocyclales bacterium GWA2_65_20]
MSQSAALVQTGEIGIFSADQCFLGLAQRVASGNTITHILRKEVGEVVIDPLRRRYTALIPKPESFYRTPPGGFRTAETKTASFPGYPERDLAELLWIAAHHASAGRLLAGCSKYDVVRLRHWPNLSRLPVTPNTMRLCAFLSRRPSAIHLARKLLGIDEDEAYSFYSAALCAGALELVSRAPARNQAEPEPVSEPAPAATGRPSERSVLRLLWNRVSRL